MQNDLVVLVDLWCDIERHAGKERRGSNGRRLCAGQAGCRGIGRDIGHEELVGTDFQHGLLVVQRGNPRARKHLQIALGFQERNQGGETAGLERQAEQRTRYAYPCSYRTGGCRVRG